MKKRLLFTPLLLLASCAVLSGCGTTKIDVNQYLTIQSTGYDSAGTADISFNVEDMVTSNPSAFVLEKDTPTIERNRIVQDVLQTIDGNLEKSTGLKNGDTISYTWDDASLKAVEDKYKVTLESDTLKYTVSNLMKVEDYNPFDYIEVVFVGTAPNGLARTDNIGENPVAGVTYHIDKMSGLCVGDSVKVSAVGAAEIDFQEYCLRDGKRATETERIYTVDALDAYATTINGIPESALQAMDSHAQQQLKKNISDNWVNPDALTGVTCLGNYLLTLKPDKPGIKQNELVFVYKVSAGFDYYYYSSYGNILIKADGTCEYDLNAMEYPTGGLVVGSLYGAAFFRNDLWYVGYESIDGLYQDVVSTKENYQCVSSLK